MGIKYIHFSDKVREERTGKGDFSSPKAVIVVDGGGGDDGGVSEGLVVLVICGWYLCGCCVGVCWCVLVVCIPTYPHCALMLVWRESLWSLEVIFLQEW